MYYGQTCMSKIEQLKVTAGKRGCVDCGRLRDSAYFGSGDGINTCHDCHQAKPFKQLAEQIKNGVQVIVADQLFPTPPELAERMVDLLEVEAGVCVLEPSAGTGNLIAPIHERVDTEVL